MDEKKIHKRLEEQVIQYFVRVQEVLEDNSFDDEESKNLFLKNVLHEVQDDFVRLSKNWKVSRILEGLIPQFKDEAQIDELFKLACNAVPHLITSRYGSHVLEQIFTVAAFKSEGKQPTKSSNSDLINYFVSMIDTHVLEKLSNLIRDMYSSHVLSAILQVLGGVQIDSKISRSKLSMNYRKRFALTGGRSGALHADPRHEYMVVTQDVPEEYQDCLKKVLQAIMEVENFGELICNQFASPVLQVALLVASEKCPPHCFLLCEKIMTKANLIKRNSGTNLQPSSMLVPLDKIGSCMVEKMLYVMSKEQQEQLFEDCIQQNILKLSMHPVGNYLVQSFLKTCSSQDSVVAVVSQICSNLDDIFKARHLQVIVQVAQACVKFGMMQTEVMKSILSWFSCEKSGYQTLKQLIRMDLSMENSSAAKEREEKETDLNPKQINYHGCCLVKQLLLFKKAKVLRRGLASMKNEEILVLCCHQYGSMVVEAFFQNEHTPMKKKMKMFPLFMGLILPITCDKFGSRVFDMFWKSLDAEHKELAKKKLIASQNEISKSFFGKFVLRNCGIINQDKNKGMKSQEQISKEKGFHTSRQLDKKSSEGYGPQASAKGTDSSTADELVLERTGTTKKKNKRKAKEITDANASESPIEPTSTAPEIGNMDFEPKKKKRKAHKGHKMP